MAVDDRADLLEAEFPGAVPVGAVGRGDVLEDARGVDVDLAPQLVLRFDDSGGELGGEGGFDAHEPIPAFLVRRECHFAPAYWN